MPCSMFKPDTAPAGKNYGGARRSRPLGMGARLSGGPWGRCTMYHLQGIGKGSSRSTWENAHAHNIQLGETMVRREG